MNTGPQHLVKVVIGLPEDHWQSLGSESLWAEDLGGGRCRLRNVPFAAYGYSFGDVVAVRQGPGGELIVEQPVSRSGHSTYRIFLSEGVSVSSPGFEEAWQPLEDLGCTFERATPRLLAVDVPTDADVHAAFDRLTRGEARGVWDFEEGHCGHETDGEHGAVSG